MRIRGAVYKVSNIISASLGTQIVVIVGFYHLDPIFLKLCPLEQHRLCLILQIFEGS